MPFGNVTVGFFFIWFFLHLSLQLGCEQYTFLCCHLCAAVAPLEMLPLSDHITLHSCSLKVYCRWVGCSSLYPFIILCAVISQSPILICVCYILNAPSYVWSLWCWERFSPLLCSEETQNSCGPDQKNEIAHCWQLRLFCLLLDNRILSLGLGLKNLQIVQSIGIVCLPFLLSMPALFSDCCNYFKLMSQSC